MQAHSIDKGLRSCDVMLSTLLLSGSLMADDLTDSNALLCYGWSASVSRPRNTW